MAGLRNVGKIASIREPESNPELPALHEYSNIAVLVYESFTRMFEERR